MICRTCGEREAKSGKHDCTPCTKLMRENLDSLRDLVRRQVGLVATPAEEALGTPSAHAPLTWPELAASIEYRARGSMKPDWLLYVPGSHGARGAALTMAGEALGCSVTLAAAEDCLVVIGLESRWPARPRAAWEFLNEWIKARGLDGGDEKDEWELA